MDAAQEQPDGQRRCRNLDHRADRNRLVEDNSLAAQAGLGALDRGQRLVDLVRLREHRNQQLDLAVLRRAQDRPQLRLKHLRLGQRQPDGAQPERRIALQAITLNLLRMQIFVVTEVEGADGDRPASHPLDHGPVSLELLVLRRHVTAIEKKELGAEQADAFRTAVERIGHIARQLDVGVQIDIDAVERCRPTGLETPELATLEFDLALAQSKLLEHAHVGVDDQHTARAVDDQHFLVANQLPSVEQTQHGRNAQAARQDGRMRRRTADIGDEGGEMVLLVGNDVGRRKVMRDDDQILFLDALAGA